jgi:peroxiredoxin
VLGISVDMPFSNAAFAAKTGATFALLSDVHRQATRAYGVSWPNFAGIEGLEVANRAAFVVDENGTVTYAWVAPNPGVEPDYATVLAALGG